MELIYPSICHAQSFLDSTQVVYDTSIVNSTEDYSTDEEEKDSYTQYESYIEEGKQQEKQFYNKRNVDNKEWQKITKNKSFNYEHEKEKKQQFKKPVAVKKQSYSFFNILAILLVASILIGVIYVMMGKYYFSRSDKPINYELENYITDIHNITDWEQQVSIAIQQMNYRLAYRLRFMQSLSMLSDKELINYHKDKTNYDYIQQIGRSEIKKEFQQMVRYFDYIWYGMFDVTKLQYLAIEQDVFSFQDKIKQL